MENTQSTIDSLRELNSRLVSQIDKLRYKFAEVEAENIKLKAENEKVKAENTDIKADNVKLKQALEEHETRITNLEQKDKVKAITNVSQSSNNTPISDISDNASARMCRLTPNSDVYQETKTRCTTSPIYIKTKSSENKEYDIKTVSQGNDRNNIESSVDIASQISNQQKTIPNTSLPAEDLDDSDEIELTKNQNIELDLIQDLQNCILIASPDSIEIPFKDIVDNEKPFSKITTQSLIHLFMKAIRSGHQEILSWICYSDNFENKVIEIRHKRGVNDKTARTQIYKEMLEHLPGVTSGALRIKTLRARKIHKLFGANGVGIDKVMYVTCSANDISKLTNAQIQNIINQVTSKTVFQGNDQNHVTETEVNISSNPICDRTYFCNKIIEQYPNLYKDGNSESVDYYGIADETLCPLCKLAHDDDEDIEGRYKIGSYYIKCEQRGIEIEANKTLTPEYLEWHNKFTGLPNVLTDNIRSKLYKRYKKETGFDPWIMSETFESPQIEKDAEKKTLFVPQVNVQSGPSKPRSPISILPKDPEERQQH
ncbi:8723_t:CDS:2, partial [Gigaspora rosea]